MIILFGHKDFKKFWSDKKSRKLFFSHHSEDPLIVDGADGDNPMLNQMSQAFSIRGYSAGGKVLSASKYGDPELRNKFTPREIKKAKKNFFGSPEFIKGTIAVTKTFLNKKGDMNIAIVVTQKSYDALSKDYIKRILKLLKLMKKAEEIDNDSNPFAIPARIDDLDDVFDETKKADVFFTYKELRKNPDILKRTPTKKELKALAKGVEKASKKADDLPWS